VAVYEIPSYSLRECTLILEPSVAQYRSFGGILLNQTEIFDSIWTVKIETLLLEERERSEWRAWKNKLRGGLDYFSMYDISKPKPYYYRDNDYSYQVGSASPGWNGTATVTALGASGALGLSGLPANYVITEDDYIGLEQSGRYGLYAAAETKTANGSGAITISVRPYLHTGIFTTSALARLWQPKATFVIDNKSWSESMVLQPSSITFNGAQRI
jgi:hypothetical protein